MVCFGAMVRKCVLAVRESAWNDLVESKAGLIERQRWGWERLQVVGVAKVFVGLEDFAEVADDCGNDDEAGTCHAHKKHGHHNVGKRANDVVEHCTIVDLRDVVSGW